jgi:hypothetical protein
MQSCTAALKAPVDSDITYGLMDCTGALVTTHSIVQHSSSLQQNASQTDEAETWQLLQQAQRGGSLVACCRSVTVVRVPVM